MDCNKDYFLPPEDYPNVFINFMQISQMATNKIGVHPPPTFPRFATDHTALFSANIA